MIRYFKEYVLFVLFFLGVVVLFFFLINTANVVKIEKVFKYNISVSNPTGNVIKKSEMWIYAPVKSNSSQEFVSLDASDKYNLINDAMGNQRLLFTVENIPPYGTKIITFELKMNMFDRPRDVSVENLSKYLKEEVLVESEDFLIKEKVSELLKKYKKETAKSLYNWVFENLKYSGFVSDDRGAAYAMKYKSGDCTEYAYLYTAMARAAGLPSRAVAGFVYSEDSRLMSKDYHNWSEVLIDNKWHIVDPQKQVFMDRHEDYVAMRIISTDMDTDLNNSQKFFNVDHPLIAAMN